MISRDTRRNIMSNPTREDALALLFEYNESEGLRRHALAVEAVMRYSARKRGYDEEYWGVVGLIHDLDYEKHPDEHCAMTRRILSERGWPEPIIRAAESHGYGICSDVEPVHEMERVLFTIDELTGLVATSALVRPSKSVSDLGVSSVKKKWKDPRFAAKVDRSVIERGAAMLGEELDSLIADTIEGMREVSAEIGL
jgi:predicted hydrolase (HD superfamily)